MILDADMPVTGAARGLRILRQRPQTSNLPGIVLRGPEEFDDALEETAGPTELYLAEPVRLGALIDAPKSPVEVPEELLLEETDAMERVGPQRQDVLAGVGS